MKTILWVSAALVAMSFGAMVGLSSAEIILRMQVEQDLYALRVLSGVMGFAVGPGLLGFTGIGAVVVWYVTREGK